MRYLLYKEATAACTPPTTNSSKPLVQKANRILGAVRRQPQPSASVMAMESPTTTASTNDDETKKVAWGQQCSETCACVVRFEAKLSNDGKGTLEQVSYHARKLVTSQQQQVQLTTQGRPMLQECNCQSLHQLSQTTIQTMMKQRTLQNFKSSSLAFQATRSSPAFCRSVLRAQGLPETHSHCLDVVEEAITALCKGYLPAPRSTPVQPAVLSYGIPRRSTTTTTPPTPPSKFRHALQGMESISHGEEDDQYQFLKFGHSWREDEFFPPITTNSPHRGFVRSFSSSMQAATTSPKPQITSVAEVWLNSLLDALHLFPVTAKTGSGGTATLTTGSDDRGQLRVDQDDNEEETHEMECFDEEANNNVSNDWVSFVDQTNEGLERAAQEWKRAQQLRQLDEDSRLTAT